MSPPECEQEFVSVCLTMRKREPERERTGHWGDWPHPVE